MRSKSWSTDCRTHDPNALDFCQEATRLTSFPYEFNSQEYIKNFVEIVTLGNFVNRKNLPERY